LINDFLDETYDYCFVLRCCHEILSFSAHCWHSVNRAGLLLYPKNRVLCGLGNTKFDDGLGWNLDLLLRLRIEADASLPFLLYELPKAGQDKFAILPNLFVGEAAQRIEEYSGDS